MASCRARTFLTERPANLSYLSGGQGLWSTVDDYLAFARIFLNDGAVDGVRLLRPETIALMRTNRLSDRQRSEANLVGMPLFGAYGFGGLRRHQRVPRARHDLATLIAPPSWSEADAPHALRPGQRSGSRDTAGSTGKYRHGRDLRASLPRHRAVRTIPCDFRGTDRTSARESARVLHARSLYARMAKK